METIKSFFLHIFWAVHLFFQRLLSNQSNKLNNMKSSRIIRPKRISRLSRDIIDYDTSKITPSVPQEPVHLLFNEKKSSLIDMSDIVTPAEEEMLRCLCAKGFEKNPICLRLSTNSSHSKACNDVGIPRDIFTNVWLNSCVPT